MQPLLLLQGRGVSVSRGFPCWLLTGRATADRAAAAANSNSQTGFILAPAYFTLLAPASLLHSTAYWCPAVQVELGPDRKTQTYCYSFASELSSPRLSGQSGDYDLKVSFPATDVSDCKKPQTDSEQNVNLFVEKYLSLMATKHFYVVAGLQVSQTPSVFREKP